MLHELSVQTSKHRDFVDITDKVQHVVSAARVQHAEGNSGGHALTSLVGPSVALPVQDGQLRLGQWQAIYLCEFDGPRRRTVQVQVLGDRGAAS